MNLQNIKCEYHVGIEIFVQVVSIEQYSILYSSIEIILYTLLHIADAQQNYN